MRSLQIVVNNGYVKDIYTLKTAELRTGPILTCQLNPTVGFYSFFLPDCLWPEKAGHIVYLIAIL